MSLYPKLIYWLRVPGYLLGIAAIIIAYVLKNPTDLYVERMLSYSIITTALKQHLLMVFVAMVAAIIVGVLAGILISRPRFYYIGRVIENIVNVGQTVPSLAILALFFTIFGLGFNTAVFALWLYSILPILRNTSAGINNVPPDVTEAARGMGMHPLRILTKIELPIAAPIIIAGIRTAVVMNVGTATLATFIGAGGLGDLIVTGIAVRRDMVIFTGAALSGITAILLDHLIGRVENQISSY